MSTHFVFLLKQFTSYNLFRLLRRYLIRFYWPYSGDKSISLQGHLVVSLDYNWSRPNSRIRVYQNEVKPVRVPLGIHWSGLETWIYLIGQVRFPVANS